MRHREMKPWHAPIAAMLEQHKRSEPVSFHVPGHQFGRGLHRLTDVQSADLSAAILPVMGIDITELSFTDDLHDPMGVIAEAQQLAAACFGAQETYFLVGGSTSGNIAMILASCKPGDRLLVPRNAHKSVINGLTLAGAEAVFLNPTVDGDTGLYLPPSPAVVEEALKSYPDAKGILMTNPSYYGLSVDLGQYANLLHAKGKLLLVDEAHGAHYGQHAAFPTSAVQAGADMVVQSTHKTLHALTMGAMLHTQGRLVDHAAIRHSLQMVQSSSPSYPIMASLDIARAMLDTYGEAWFEPGLGAVRKVREALHAAKGRFEAVQIEQRHCRMDPLRLLLQDKLGQLSGFEIQQQLEKHNIWAEMADTKRVVLLFGAQTTEADAERLLQALHHITDEQSSLSCGSWISTRATDIYESELEEELAAISEPVMFDRNLVKSTVVDLEAAVGHCAAEMVVPYPPGIPLVYRSERITVQAVNRIRSLAAAGARFQGASDPAMRTISIIVS
ncbi:aminotransferase class I/II-fold pyridoxal phosphate-dependent enzyme [Paenibacillus methanolicus]|uniref:Arginine/lysine/ornithine decarboxylase n=1 Tax=Paenibacillus methanolicus TaxID=582686 RepID=A0A5S5BP34_9BACL|nr:aminotransferase class I/II-fold pyridoxal phosphate-dependent enzyme [Paenibacillus methanolicus]TYP67970.1 arginine/lysine/ornithine decarboxylase [Paenibacillus methanolicus]